MLNIPIAVVLSSISLLNRLQCRAAIKVDLKTVERLREGEKRSSHFVSLFTNTMGLGSIHGGDDSLGNRVRRSRWSEIVCGGHDGAIHTFVHNCACINARRANRELPR